MGRFYYRAWRFGREAEGIDWELNVLLADPQERGKGYGTAAQHIVLQHLLGRPECRSVFAYTYRTNRAERRALEKAGFAEMGPLPHTHYRAAVRAVHRLRDSQGAEAVKRAIRHRTLNRENRFTAKAPPEAAKAVRG